MSLEIAVARRVFKMGTVTLDDPDPDMLPDEVRKLFAVSYEHLEFASVLGPVPGAAGTIEYTFEPPWGKSKGTGGHPFAHLTQDECEAALRFRQTTVEDGEGYDVEPEMMKRLASKGVVIAKPGGYYEGELTAMMPLDTVVFCAECCANCSNLHFYCDLESGPWCDGCWPKQACGRGDHSEGCATKVIG